MYFLLLFLNYNIVGLHCRIVKKTLQAETVQSMINGENGSCSVNIKNSCNTQWASFPCLGELSYSFLSWDQLPTVYCVLSVVSHPCEPFTAPEVFCWYHFLLDASPFPSQALPSKNSCQFHPLALTNPWEVGADFAPASFPDVATSQDSLTPINSANSWNN